MDYLFLQDILCFLSLFRNANVFLHPVTDDIAPGYGNVVLR